MSHPKSILPFERPETDSIRHAGWQIVSQVGRYCVAFRNGQEVVFIWQAGGWQRISATLRKAG